eukprot:135310_1
MDQSCPEMITHDSSCSSCMSSTGLVDNISGTRYTQNQINNNINNIIINTSSHTNQINNNINNINDNTQNNQNIHSITTQTHTSYTSAISQKNHNMGHNHIHQYIQLPYTPKCQLIHRNKTNIQTMHKISSNSTNGKFICPGCGKKFKKLFGLTRHIFDPHRNCNRNGRIYYGPYQTQN